MCCTFAFVIVVGLGVVFMLARINRLLVGFTMQRLSFLSVCMAIEEPWWLLPFAPNLMLFVFYTLQLPILFLFLVCFTNGVPSSSALFSSILTLYGIEKRPYLLLFFPGAETVSVAHGRWVDCSSLYSCVVPSG